MLQELLLDEAVPQKRYRLKIISRELPADLETPVSAFLKLRDFGAKVLLESVEYGITLGRYSFVGFQLHSQMNIHRNQTIIENSAGKQVFTHNGRSPLQYVKDILGKFTIDADPMLTRLLGGVVGNISYDFIRFIENIPDISKDLLGTPLASFYFIDTLLVFDHVQRRMRVMSLSDDSSSKEITENIEAILDRLRSPLTTVFPQDPIKSCGEPVSNLGKEGFCRGVEKVKEHILSGDVYQLVLSQRYSGETDADPFLIYRALRMLNPSPYMFFLEMKDVTLIGSSPEALVSLENGRASVHPIAGTRPRGATDKEDRQLGEELMADEKEKAEHVMLVDLGRNDLGRCCVYGSVSVPEFMNIERYSHVMHICSHVTGKLKPGLDQFDLFCATFPAGTVSGAPKIRAMQIIEELEGLKRGPYAGAVGYFSLSGDTDWCIGIRTIIMKGRKYFLQAGAGIVADSIPENEWVESNNKLAALRKAIELAEEGL
ncbi:MAG: anthranilate synthase component I [FCB group bacterium]|nr:anthranilate synthase component I [FCB group bacterium]